MSVADETEANRTAHVAVVGAGPSGCYTALALRKLLPAAEISVFDMRTSPFGLVRYGVAPDHQGMKNVSRQFERLFAAENVNFFGGVTIGGDLAMDDIVANYDAVVVATGLASDRPLDLDTDTRARVVGAGALMRYLNADIPPEADGGEGRLGPLGRDVIIIGAGNVALDVARLLAKTNTELAGSDIDDDARDNLKVSEVRSIRILGRGQLRDARWDPAMLTELRALEGADVSVEGDSPATGDRDVTHISIEFSRTPDRISYNGDRTVLITTDTMQPSARHEHEADTIITATGFVAGGPELPGHIAVDSPHHVVRIGGCASGVLGNLAENRTLAKEAAAEVVALIDTSEDRFGADAIRPLLGPWVLSYDDWKALDAEEISRAQGSDRVRRKISSRHEVAELVRQHRQAAQQQAGSEPTSTQTHR